MLRDYQKDIDAVIFSPNDECRKKFVQLLGRGFRVVGPSGTPVSADDQNITVVDVHKPKN
jgi:type I site-specific restriction endonuclease